MKAISIKQPWASMIARGEKTIETRVWSTDYRGALLICASKRPVLANRGEDKPKGKPSFPVGVAICIVDLIDCRPMTRGDEKAAACELYPRAWAWLLGNVRLVEPVPIRGQLRFFNVPESIIRPLPIQRGRTSIRNVALHSAA